MSKGRYFIWCFFLTFIAAAYPFWEAISTKYRIITYDNGYHLLLISIFPFLIGVFLFLFKKIPINKLISGVFLLINLGIIWIIWIITPGKLAIYNFIICGMLATSLIVNKESDN